MMRARAQTRGAKDVRLHRLRKKLKGFVAKVTTELTDDGLGITTTLNLSDNERVQLEELAAREGVPAEVLFGEIIIAATQEYREIKRAQGLG